MKIQHSFIFRSFKPLAPSNSIKCFILSKEVIKVVSNSEILYSFSLYREFEPWLMLQLLTELSWRFHKVKFTNGGWPYLILHSFLGNKFCSLRRQITKHGVRNVKWRLQVYKTPSILTCIWVETKFWLKQNKKKLASCWQSLVITLKSQRQLSWLHLIHLKIKLL